MPATGYLDRPGLLPGAVGWAVAYDLRGPAQDVHRGLPSPWLGFIVAVDEPVTVHGTVSRRSRPTSYDVVVAGLHPEAALVEQPAHQSGVQLAVHPLAARRLFGCRAAELRDPATEGADVLGAAVVELRERVSEAAGPGGRLDVVQEWLRDRASASANSAAGRMRPELVHAWTVVQRSGGRVRVEQVARDVGLSPRQLRSLMAAETGMSPKRLVRHVRFEAVVSRLAAGTASLAEVAAGTGYADQAHLSREFARMAGCSPTQWLAEERRNIQDGGHRAGRDWRHERDD
ncbi:MAG TPA: helix-turn-helix transcriptional regulator [Marmoricola sp.]|nr:helix-turn-helix transcriptional regulator [Marmoricola sp.]